MVRCRCYVGNIPSFGNWKRWAIHKGRWWVILVAQAWGLLVESMVEIGCPRREFDSLVEWARNQTRLIGQGQPSQMRHVRVAGEGLLNW